MSMFYILRRMTFVSIWVIGMPTSVVLGYVSRPVLELTGLWLGFIISAALQAIGLLLQVICLNWQKEFRRMKVRQIVYKCNARAKASGPVGLSGYYNQAETVQMSLSDTVLFDDNSSTSVSGRVIGSFNMKVKTMQEEMMELELVEVSEWTASNELLENPYS